MSCPNWLLRDAFDRCIRHALRQSSVESFLAFASHDAYRAILGHRTAALEDARLLPLTELTLLAAADGPPERLPAG